ncbi:hypothetical protein [Ruegeria marina]|uniref:hypothetical protein n=1 Tax=Ruegeria marina TaxID=639004 RepID=UPI000B88D6C4|nr:hypothetical protein [Ruegeria marina]
MKNGELIIDTGLVQGKLRLSDIGLYDRVFDVGELERRIRVFQLTETLEQHEMRCTTTAPVASDGRDTPIWIRTTTEDRRCIWTRPVYIIAGAVK